MQHEITITLTLDSPKTPEQLRKQIKSAIEFSSVRDVLTDALELDMAFRLVSVDARYIRDARL